VEAEIQRCETFQSRLVAASTNVMIGRAGFKAAVQLFPVRVYLRQGSWTIADRSRGDC